MSDSEGALLEKKVIYLPPKPNGLITDFNRIQYENKKCFWPRCTDTTVRCHVLSKSSIRKYAQGNIANLQITVQDSYFPIKPKNKWKHFRSLNLDKEPTFHGFCSKHDRDLFKELDNYTGVMTHKIALQAHYRVLCYGLEAIQLELKRHDFLKQACFIGGSTKRSKEIVRKLQNGFFERGLKWAETDYLCRKELCEQMMASSSEASGINYIYMQGNTSSPLFFGRGGTFLHAFNKTKSEQKKLPGKFMKYMPYIMYFTIYHNDKVDLFFSYLTVDEKQYVQDLDRFLDKKDLGEGLEFLIGGHSDCCILYKDSPIEWQNTLKEIINFHR